LDEITYTSNWISVALASHDTTHKGHFD